MMEELAMRVAGWTLTVMAVMLHFSVCEWGWNGYFEEACIVPFLPFVQAREQFATHHSGLPITYNTMAAGFWGLVIPLGLAVAGIGLILRDPRPTILRRVGRWLRSAGQWLRKRAAPLAAGVAVIMALLVTILLFHHSGRGVATAPVDWEKELTSELGPPPPDGSGIFQKYEQMSGQELAKIWEPPNDAELVPESEIHESHAWLRQRSARQWHSKNPDNLSNTITAFRVQFPNESWTEERELEYRNFLAADAFHQIAIVALRKRSSVSVWTPADTKLGIPPPPDYYKGLNSADWTPETGIPPPPDVKNTVSAPIEVDVEGVGIIEFPASMTPQEIQGVLSRKYPAADCKWVKTSRKQPIQPPPPPKK
jgi:hypothetical protein